MSQYDFTFAWEGVRGDGAWSLLQVVEFRGHEEMSRLYRYEVTLLAKQALGDGDASGEVDPRDLVRARATLRIRTLSDPMYKVVHGIVTEAEEIGPAPDGMLYRVVMMPPLIRAQYRKRCRVFLEKTTRQILEAVLQGDPSLSLAKEGTVEPDDGALGGFTPAAETFTFRLTDGARLDDVSVRPYCVQYNESDLAFVARLLEEEGLSYHIENGREACLLVISDKDAGRARLDPFAPLGPNVPGREISAVKLGARLRPKVVAIGDYNWKKPALDMLAERKVEADSLFDFSYPGGFPETPEQGVPLATAMLERFETEADYAVLEGKCRVLSAGSIFHLEHPKSRYEGEYLVTKLQVRGEQQGVLKNDASGKTVPFSVHVECARKSGDKASESRFRPARVTPRPRIYGTQTAFVTADPSSPGAEINVGGPPGAEIGCVRVRFHWDRDAARLGKEPSSCWVRVSQLFAGPGQGGMFHPRVGTEVIVDYEDGNPDRPIVVGRVYNGANVAPGLAVGASSFSTMKTYTSPGGGKYNEFSFEDGPGKEEVKLHAAHDWNSECGHDRSESVANDSSSSVGANRSESTAINYTKTVGSNSMVVIGANSSETVGANQSLSVGGNQTALIAGNQSEQIGENQSLHVSGNQSSTIDGSRDATVTGSDTQTITGATLLHSSTSQTMTAPTQAFQADGLQVMKCSDHEVICDIFHVNSSGPATIDCKPFTVTSGSSATVTASAAITLTGNPIALSSGSTVTIDASGAITITGGPVTVNGASVTLNGGTVTATAGGVVTVSGGGDVHVKGSIIHLN
ncbi:MAG: type VI secretion system tip protein TssI/VgrG [Byssovorax sp.]